MYHKMLLAIDYEDDGEGKRALEEGVRLLGEDSEDWYIMEYGDFEQSTFM